MYIHPITHFKLIGMLSIGTPDIYDDILTMSNVTTSRYTYPIVIRGKTINEDHFRALLLLSDAVNAVIIACYLYLIVCVVTYGYISRAWMKMNRSNGTNCRRERGIIYTLCLVAIIIDIPRLILTEIIIHATSMAGALERCELLIDVSNIAAGLGVLPRFLFLWYRQHTINCHPSIGAFKRGVTKLISYIIIAGIVVLTTVTTVLYVSPHSHTHSSIGCVFRSSANDSRNSHNLRVSYACMVAANIIVTQLFLLALFIYPLIGSWNNNRKLKRKHVNGTVKAPVITVHSSNGTDSTSSSKNDRKDKLLALIQRSTASVVMSVTVDLIVMVTMNNLSNEVPVALAMTVYNISVGIHVLCSLFTFSFRKDIFTVFCGIMTKQLQYGANTDYVTSNNNTCIHNSGVNSAVAKDDAACHSSFSTRKDNSATYLQIPKFQNQTKWCSTLMLSCTFRSSNSETRWTDPK